ncbi:hypothetical protein D3C73_1217280 [compost metagenome]
MKFAGDALQLLQHAVMTVDDEGMQVECNIYEAYSTGEYDQREVVAVRKVDHFLRDAAEIGAQLNAQAGGVLINEILHKRQG